MSGEETDESKLLRVWGIDGGFITQALHKAITWGTPAIDAGSRRGRGRTCHICGVLPQDYEAGGVTSTRVSRNFPHRR